jgi:hypothetical protein
VTAIEARVTPLCKKNELSESEARREKITESDEWTVWDTVLGRPFRRCLVEVKECHGTDYNRSPQKAVSLESLHC